MKKFALLLAAVLLTACGMKPGDEAVAQQVTAHLLQRHSGIIYEVIDFKKVNGISRNNDTYDAEVEYRLRFLVDLTEASERLQHNSGSIFAAGLEATTLGLAYGNFKQGDTIYKKEWIHFVRSEQGWLIEEVQK
ncbi:MAG: hypothetical protein ABFS08_12965 [Pseudomonadota bacterium]